MKVLCYLLIRSIDERSRADFSMVDRKVEQMKCKTIKEEKENKGSNDEISTAERKQYRYEIIALREELERKFAGLESFKGQLKSEVALLLEENPNDMEDLKSVVESQSVSITRSTSNIMDLFRGMSQLQEVVNNLNESQNILKEQVDYLTERVSCLEDENKELREKIEKQNCIKMESIPEQENSMEVSFGRQKNISFEQSTSTKQQKNVLLDNSHISAHASVLDVFRMKHPNEYLLDRETYKIVEFKENQQKQKLKKYENGMVEKIMKDNNFNLTYPSNLSITYFYNGDVKQEFPDGRVVHHYSVVDTVEVMLPSKVKYLKYNNGKIEKIMPDGSKTEYVVEDGLNFSQAEVVKNRY